MLQDSFFFYVKFQPEERRRGEEGMKKDAHTPLLVDTSF